MFEAAGPKSSHHTDAEDLPRRMPAYFLMTGAFFGISLLTIYLLNRYFLESRMLLDSRLLDPWVIACVAAILVSYYLADGLRLYFVVRAMDHQVPFRFIMKLVFVNIMFSNATPMATGGGFVQIWFLNRSGMGVGEALAATSIRTMLASLGMLVLAPAFFVLEPDLFDPLRSGKVFLTYTFVAVIYLAVVYMVIFRVRIFRVLLYWVMRFLHQSRILSRRRFRKYFLSLSGELDCFSKGFRSFISGPLHYVTASFLCACLFLILLFSFSVILIRGLGYDLPVVTILAIQSVVTFFMYFTPTPGAVGFAESAYMILFSRFISEHDIAFLTVSWRFLTIYLGVLLGVAVTCREIFRLRPGRPGSRSMPGRGVLLVLFQLLWAVSGGAADANLIETPSPPTAMSASLEHLAGTTGAGSGTWLFSLLGVGLGLVLGVILMAAISVYRKIKTRKILYRDFELDVEKREDQPLRVALFTDNYLPYVGGVPLSIQRLARGLEQRGTTVKIFAPSYGNGKPADDDELVYRCRTVFMGRKVRFPITNIYSRELTRELEDFHPDLVHVHHPFWLGNRGRKLARRLRLPVVFTYHTRLDSYMHNVPLPGKALKELLAHHIVKRFSNRCDAVIAPSSSNEEYLRRLGVLPIIVTIPTGVDVMQYPSARSRDVVEFRQRYVRSGERLLLSISRLADEKNVEFLIDGLGLTREKSSTPFRCLLVGDGPRRGYLENKVAMKGMEGLIVFTGSLEPEEVVKACLASDLFVFASKSETQGMVLLEAMAGGCPVVAVCSSGVSDFIEDGINGVTVPEKLELWSGSVALLLDNSRLRETLSGNSREFADRYTLQAMADQVLKLYRRTLLARAVRY